MIGMHTLKAARSHSQNLRVDRPPGLLTADMRFAIAHSNPYGLRIPENR
jgi:hypothetical protein